MIKMRCQPKTQDWNVGGFVEICGYNRCTGQTMRLKHVMGKLPAIAAVFAFLWVQFVHTAVLDATEPHDDFQAALMADDAHDGASDPHHGPHHGDDDDRGMGPLHQSIHDHHHVVCLTGHPPLVKSVPDGARVVAKSDLTHGRSLSPPVPPPLS